MNITPTKAAQILLADLYLAITNFHFHFPKMEKLSPVYIAEIGFVTGEICAMLRDENLNTEILFERIYFLFELLENLGADQLMHSMYLADFVLLIDAAKQGKAMPQGVSPSGRCIISKLDDEIHFPSKAESVNAGLGTFFVSGRSQENSSKNFIKKLH